MLFLCWRCCRGNRGSLRPIWTADIGEVTSMALECNRARASGAMEQVIPTVTIIPIREYLRDPPHPFAADMSHLAATPWFYPFVP